MLHSITWSTYIFSICISAFLYYAALGWMYYRKSVKAFLHGRKVAKAADIPSDTREVITEQRPSLVEEESNNFKLAATVSEQLKKIIQTTVEAKVERPDLIEAVRSHLITYRHLKGTKYATAITNAIDRELKDHQINLSEGELKSFWVAI